MKSSIRPSRGADRAAAKAGRAARNALAVLAAACSLSALAACSSADNILPFDDYDHLPESGDVDDAPWPRLVDAPPPVSVTGENNVKQKAAKGGEILSDIEAERAALLEIEAEMRANPVVVDPGLEAEAARVSAEGRALDNR